MNRQTEYIKNYGCVTQNGDGIFDNLSTIAKTIVSSPTVQVAGKEAFKAASKSAGNKLGSKLCERVFERKDKKVSLKDIYGDSLFRANGLKESKFTTYRWTLLKLIDYLVIRR